MTMTKHIAITGLSQLQVGDIVRVLVKKGLVKSIVVTNQEGTAREVFREHSPRQPEAWQNKRRTPWRNR